MKETPSFLLQPKLIWLAVLSSNYWLYGFIASRLQKKIFFGVFSYYWLLLKSYHLILMLMTAIGLQKTFNGS